MPSARLLVFVSLLSAVACGSSEPPAPEPAPQPAAEAPAPAAEPEPEPEAEVAVPTVNLNTASEEAMGAVPGATPKMVHEFEEYRPYVSIVQYRKEIGKYAPKDQVLAWEEHLFVPIDIDNCDAATLAQWPGLDKPTATTVLEARPFADQAAFVAALKPHVSAAELEAGRALLKK